MIDRACYTGVLEKGEEHIGFEEFEIVRKLYTMSRNMLASLTMLNINSCG